MADSFNKKEREKKRQKKKRDKAEKRLQKKSSDTKPLEFMYVGEDGNLTAEKPTFDPSKETSISDISLSYRKEGGSSESKFTKTGSVKFFNTEKGYGFIEEKDSGESYFVHIDNLSGPIKEHDKVTFEVGKGPKGPVALSVKLV